MGMVADAEKQAKRVEEERRVMAGKRAAFIGYASIELLGPDFDGNQNVTIECSIRSS